MDSLSPQYKETRSVPYALSTAYCTRKDKVPNTIVLQICNLTGIEAMIMTAQYRWVGHVTRMDDTRLPKIIFYSELEHGTPCRGGQLKDMLKMNIRVCDMQPKELEHITSDRSLLADSGAGSCLRASPYTVTSKQACSTQGRQLSPDCGFTCDICSRVCASRIGLTSHQRTHL